MANNSLMRVASILDGITDAPPAMRSVLADQLLTELLSVAPEVAKICAPLLAMSVSPAHASHILEVVGRYEGGPLFGVPRVSLDLLLFAPKLPERNAILAAVGVSIDQCQSIPVSVGLDVLAFTMGNLRIGLIYSGPSGVAEAAQVAALALSAVHPRRAVLIGMAAGTTSQKLCDVVVAESLWNYEFETVVADSGCEQAAGLPDRLRGTFAARSLTIPPRLHRKVGDFLTRDQNWGVRTAREIVNYYAISENASSAVVRESALFSSQGITVRFGHILSGNKIREGGTTRFLEAFHDRARAIEMEGYGFGLACDEMSVPWAVVRGIADYGESDRTQSLQQAATFAAARLVIETVVDGSLLPLESPV